MVVIRQIASSKLSEEKYGLLSRFPAEVMTISKQGGTQQIDLVYVDWQDEQLLRQVIELGDRNQRTLGFLPHAAFRRAAESRTLLAAVCGGQAVGYALYSLPWQVVRLSHLCIAESARGQGIARRLVDALSERHADRFGITLRCRNDYAANNMWPLLGFSAQGERRGRGRRGLPLTIWWRDHGHPNLFSSAESIGLLRVAIDVNVFLDLESTSDRHSVAASRALADDWLSDQLELVVTPELMRELGRMPDGQEKSRQHQAAASNYQRLAVDSSASATLVRHITEQVLKRQAIDLSADPADQSDVRHVAEAALAGVTVLATKDERLLKWAVGAFGETGVRVMHPSEVILAVDELARAQAYRPVQLQDTRYRLVPVRSGSEGELLAFLHTSQGEQKAHYLDLIRRVAAGGPQWTRLVLRDPADKPVAFFVTGDTEQELTVPILRIAGAQLEQTVTRQILFRLRNQARRENRSIVRITEPSVATETERILREDGFLRIHDDWVALVVQACADASTVNAVISQAAQQAGLRLQSLQPELSAVIATDVERKMWPVKVTDSLLPTYLVPIKPAWSADLFGIPQAMTPRPNRLGLSCEHVYYRSPTPPTAAPARVIWYVTDAPRGGVAAVIGSSRLEETITDTPPVLFQRFRHLGVWRLDQVTHASKGGKVQGLRFADTEIFPQPIPLRHLKQLAAEHGQSLALRSPQRISPGLFTAIYQKGHRAT
jgi:GNAT superfamily N-acetyltransferase/predicted nucleic acid-binding protein